MPHRGLILKQYDFPFGNKLLTCLWFQLESGTETRNRKSNNLRTECKCRQCIQNVCSCYCAMNNEILNITKRSGRNGNTWWSSWKCRKAVHIYSMYYNAGHHESTFLNSVQLWSLEWGATGEPEFWMGGGAVPGTPLELPLIRGNLILYFYSQNYTCDPLIFLHFRFLIMSRYTSHVLYFVSSELPGYSGFDGVGY